ncbi:MAG: DUF882 domain-containing protein [Kofleriaceae bacterium]|nr:DUF882 domain-containing protein [Myxococcales bacterium]MCB9560447.1 DUF882 domain-containing protein [Kofleriaceae bacterium]MCB9571623.1 DUF882 domain-containing protein [Kofleriaceae bacterium]
MLLSLLPLQVVALAASLSLHGLLPAPPPGAALDVTAAALGAQDAMGEPVSVVLYDANHKDTYRVTINRDGTIDDDAREILRHAFRCRRSEREHKIDQGLLAMIADVQAHWPGKTIEYISAYRGWRGERRTSPHRAGIALDFRIPGVKLTELRDYVWGRFEHVGVGWYPTRDFVHMDHRGDKDDIAWTEVHGSNRYNPSWSKRVRAGVPTPPRVHHSRVGL